MNLYLVRHGEALREEDDPERPLSDAGWADVRRMADYVATHLIIDVDRVLHSGKARARQTAEVLAGALVPSPGVDMTDGLEPMSDPMAWGERLADTREDLVLVGHLPHLARLSSLLLSGDGTRPLVAFQTGAILRLERDDKGGWSVRWMVDPSVV